MFLIQKLLPGVWYLQCEKEMECCVTGYHIHKEMWRAATGEVLIYTLEPSNMVDRYAIVGVNSETGTVHLP